MIHGFRGHRLINIVFFFFFQAEDGIRDLTVTGVQTCALPISLNAQGPRSGCSAEVYRAEHPERGPCAFKVLRQRLRGDPTAVKRFLREAGYGERESGV